MLSHSSAGKINSISHAIDQNKSTVYVPDYVPIDEHWRECVIDAMEQGENGTQERKQEATRAPEISAG